MFIPNPRHPLESGVSYHMPGLACSAQAQINPRTPAIYEQSARWITGMLPWPDPEDLNLALEMWLGSWDVSAFSMGDVESVTTSACMTSTIFVVDDLTDFSGIRPLSLTGSAGHAYAPAFADLWRRFGELMAPAVFGRYRAAWAEWHDSVTEEAEIRGRQEIPDLDTYLTMRQVTVGLRPYVVYLEHVLGIDLEDLLRTDSELRELAETSVRHGLLVNDTQSWWYDYSHGDYHNIIAILIHVHGYSVQDAVNEACRRSEVQDDHRRRLSDDIRARYAGHPRGNDVRAWADALGAFCAANIWWGNRTTRYGGPGYGWNGHRAGQFTYRAGCLRITPPAQA